MSTPKNMRCESCGGASSVPRHGLDVCSQCLHKAEVRLMGFDRADAMTTPKGGSRRGAGRKPKHGTRKPGRTIRMLPETWDRLRSLSIADACSDSETVERLLRRALKLPKLQ